MGTKAKWTGGNLNYYDGTTFETENIMAPVQFYDDFIGYTGIVKYAANENTTAVWKTLESVTTLTLGVVADSANGILSLPISAANEVEDVMLYFGDQRPFSLAQGCIFETRLAMAVVPTTVSGVSTSATWGLASDHNATPDSVTVNAWFTSRNGDTKVYWETDDNSTNDDDNDTGVTLAAHTHHIYRIDASDTAAVKFYIDGVLVGTGVMSNLDTTDVTVQPYFRMNKAAGTSTGTMYIDYVKVWQNRS